jgi:hypothetical protein
LVCSFVSLPASWQSQRQAGLSAYHQLNWQAGLARHTFHRTVCRRSASSCGERSRTTVRLKIRTFASQISQGIGSRKTGVS